MTSAAGRSDLADEFCPNVERAMSAQGKNVAKYLNSPETALFQKRKILYAADLARAACREAGWVAVVEGYTDVIAAHQVGLSNVVGTLGTALGEDHVQGLQAAGRSRRPGLRRRRRRPVGGRPALEFFLGHELDVRVLSLPANLDPCDFLLKEGAEAFPRPGLAGRRPAGIRLERAGRGSTSVRSRGAGGRRSGCWASSAGCLPASASAWT